MSEYLQEEDAVMTIGASGQLQGKLTKADETRKRLQAAQDRVAAPVAPSMAPGGDVMTAEEIAAAFSNKGGKKVCLCCCVAEGVASVRSKQHRIVWLHLWLQSSMVAGGTS